MLFQVNSPCLMCLLYIYCLLFYFYGRYKEYFDKQTRAMLKREEELAQLRHQQLQQQLGADFSSPEGTTPGSDDLNHTNNNSTKTSHEGLGNSIDDVKRLVAEIKSMSFLAEPFKGDSIASPTASTDEDAAPLAPAKSNKNGQKNTKEVNSDAKAPRKPVAAVKKTKTATEKKEKKVSPKANKK